MYVADETIGLCNRARLGVCQQLLVRQHMFMKPLRKNDEDARPSSGRRAAGDASICSRWVFGWLEEAYPH